MMYVVMRHPLWRIAILAFAAAIRSACGGLQNKRAGKRVGVPALSCCRLLETALLLYALVVRIGERFLDRAGFGEVHIDVLRWNRAGEPLGVNRVDLAGLHHATDRLVDQRLELL